MLPSSDTVTYTGTVTGINEKGDTYTKTITSPLIVTDYKGSLIVSAGTMTYVDGTDSYLVSFQADPSHKHLTLVTITNTVTGKTKEFRPQVWTHIQKMVVRYFNNRETGHSAGFFILSQTIEL